MSRNSKSARLISEGKNNRRAKNNGPTGPISTGNKGAAKTTPKHSKKRAWFQLYDTHSDYLKAQKGNKRKQHQEEKADAAADDADDKAA